jgi:hypothetical protein
MATAFREYVSMRGLGDDAACKEVAHAMTELIKSANSSRQCMSFFYCVMYSDGDVSDELLEPVTFRKLTRGEYPALWVNLTYDIDNVSVTQLRHLEDKLDLRLFSAGISQKDHPF